MHLLMGSFELGGKLEMCGAYEGILIGIYNYFNVFLDGPPDDTTADALEVFFLRPWLGSKECAKLGFLDWIALGTKLKRALGIKLGVSDISWLGAYDGPILGYSNGSQHLSPRYPIPARKKLSWQLLLIVQISSLSHITFSRALEYPQCSQFFFIPIVRVSVKAMHCLMGCFEKGW